MFKHLTIVNIGNIFGRFWEIMGDLSMMDFKNLEVFIEFYQDYKNHFARNKDKD